MNKQRHRLFINDLSLQVHLGCTANERSVSQEIRIHVEFRFHQAPKGFETDQLEHTICYAETCDLLTKVCHSQEFNLIEMIANKCFQLLHEKYAAKAEIALKVHKVKPPIKDLLGGTIYTCGDFYS